MRQVPYWWSAQSKRLLGLGRVHEQNISALFWVLLDGAIIVLGTIGNVCSIYLGIQLITGKVLMFFQLK